MEFNFIPTKLIMAKEEVKKRHSRISEPGRVEQNNELYHFIKHLAQLNERDLEKEAYALTNKEVEQLAGYIPYNFYKVDLSNLFCIFQMRSNLRFCSVLFYAWQNSFDKSECNVLMQKLVEWDENFKRLISECHMTSQKWSWILEQDNIPLAYGKETRLVNNREANSLKDKLSYLGIKPNSALAIKCERLFYTFCEKEDYIAAGELKLLDILKKQDDSYQRMFLTNFLEKMPLPEMKKFLRLADYFVRNTGDKNSTQFKRYFMGFEYRIIRKYIDWINVYKINKIFGNDERSLFWEKYHYEDVNKHSYSNSIVMEFEKYVAIEFLGQANGPAYIYKKEYFDKNLRNSFHIKRYDNISLRRYLYNSTQYADNARNLRDITGTRLIHNPNPGWTDKFSDVLLRNQITERLW